MSFSAHDQLQLHAQEGKAVSLLESEIFSQPAVLDYLLEQETEHIKEIVAALPPFQYILIAARGSSDHAALYAKYIWGSLLGYPVALAAPSLHTLYDATPRYDGALVVGISQSGQSPDIVAVLTAAQKQGRPTIAITNDPDSPLARNADHVVALHAGQERSVAATKTYTAQVAIMSLFAAAWSKDPARFAEIQQIPRTIESILINAKDIRTAAERYRYMDECAVIGRGYNYSSAFELSLKLKELTYIMAIAYSSADFRHGPIATVDNGLPTILFMPQGAAYADMLELAQDLKSRQAELLIVSDVEEALALSQTRLTLPAGIPEWLTPLVSIVPGQLLAMYLTEHKGYSLDAPRGLNKVTRTL